MKITTIKKKKMVLKNRNIIIALCLIMSMLFMNNAFADFEEERKAEMEAISASIEVEDKNKEVKTINGIPDDIDLDQLLLIELKDGIVVIQMYPDVAPWHVYRIKLLTAEGFYNGLPFFRAIPNYMVQTGDPKGNGTGGSKYGTIQAEIDKKLRHERGTVSMARANGIDTANSQFFIVLDDKNAKHLDGDYTIFGKVIQGMEYVDNIKMGSIDNNGIVAKPDKIIKARLGQEMNYNYEGDTREEKEKRYAERIEILRNLKELKKMNDTISTDDDKNTSLLDKIFELNSEL